MYRCRQVNIDFPLEDVELELMDIVNSIFNLLSLRYVMVKHVQWDRFYSPQVHTLYISKKKKKMYSDNSCF